MGVPDGSIITEARALRTDELPREIIRRHDEMSALTWALKPLTSGGRGESVIIDGPSGAGKTAVARRGVEKLQSEAPHVDAVKVEGWDRSSASVLRRIVRGISRAPVHNSVGRQALIDRLREREDDVVVILDEMDQLREWGCLHDLFGTRGIVVIGTVSQFQELTVEVDQRIASRLRSARHICFNAYTDTELVAILEDRADWGLSPTAVKTATLRYIARAAEGDSRRAIALLRHAAQEADQRGRSRISREMVNAAEADAERAVRETSLAKLSTDHRRLYSVVSEAGEVAVAEMYDRYREAAASDPSDRTIRRLRQKLVDYGLLEAQGPKQDRRYIALES